MAIPALSKMMWFEEELLPNWAQLLDVAASSCLAAEETRQWFSRFARAAGVDDSGTIARHCKVLKSALEANRDLVLSELLRGPDDRQMNQIFEAWQYTLDTMIQEAASRKTCAWRIDGADETDGGGFGDGEIGLRRV